MPSWVNSSQGNRADLVSSFLLLPSYQLPLVMVAWSLIHELWFYLVFAFLLKFDEKKLFPCLLAWGGIIIAFNLLVPSTSLSPGMRLVFHSYTLEFIMGAMVALSMSRENKRFTARFAYLTLAVVILVGIPLVHYLQIVDKVDLGRAVILGIMYGALLLSVVILEREGKLAVPKFWSFTGDASYTIYLSHVLVLSAIGRMWKMTNPLPHQALDNILATLVMFIAVLAYSWVGYRVVELPVLNLSHRLRKRWFS
jgi:peptidoglycan/LPS O-acetylase OafA/YrhL